LFQSNLMTNRRSFLLAAAGALAPIAKSAAKVTSKERVDRALKGDKPLDRPPFSFWHHFGLQDKPPENQASATLAFHRQFRTDLVKVMSDYPYPKPNGKWYELAVLDNPFPAELRALELIRDGLGGEAYFVETIFNPWNVAEKLSSPAEVQRLKRENPKALADALEVIAESEANHATKAITTGAAGIFLAIANAQPEFLSQEEYAKWSEPYDRLILDAVKEAPLNILHLHGDHVYLSHFTRPWPAHAINYSVQGTGVPFQELRKTYRGTLIGGLDEKNFRSLDEKALKAEWQRAQEQAGARFILAPGCSVPNESTDAELRRLVTVIGA
jgi:uroporphyrinogen decarboxylase